MSLWPENEWFLEPENVTPLAQLLGLDADSMLMSSEMAVVKAYIVKEFKPGEHLCVGDVCAVRPVVPHANCLSISVPALCVSCDLWCQ